MTPTMFTAIAATTFLAVGAVVGIVCAIVVTIAAHRRHHDEPIPYMPVHDGRLVTDILGRRDGAR